MQFNFGFNVTASCNVYNESTELIDKTTIILDLDLNSASNFIFKFRQNRFEVNEYIANFKYNEKNEIIAIVLFKEDKVYVVTNPHQLLSEITEGYFRVRTMQKLCNIIDFDFETYNSTTTLDDLLEDDSK